jgi:uncharacterized protein YukE
MNSVHPVLAAELAHLDLQVTPENVLQVAGALRAEADYLGRELRSARRDGQVGEPGEDPVSRPAAVAFNAKIDAMWNRVQEYVDVLSVTADRLAATARDYGHSDEAIQRAFDSVRAGYGATQTGSR